MLTPPRLNPYSQRRCSPLLFLAALVLMVGAVLFLFAKSSTDHPVMQKHSEGTAPRAIAPK